MEIIVVLVAGFVLMIPVIAIIALVRSGNVRHLLEETNTELRGELSDLRSEVANLRRDFSRLSSGVSQQPASATVNSTETVTKVAPVIASAMETAAANPISAEPPPRIIPQVPPLLVQAPAIPPPPVAVKAVSLAPDQLPEAPASASHPATPLVTAHQFREESRKNSVQ